MWRLRIGAATSVLAVFAACSSFQATAVGDAGDGGGDAPSASVDSDVPAADGALDAPTDDGAPDAAVPDAGPITIRCQGTTCSGDDGQVCCIHFDGTDDVCIPRPNDVLAHCPDGGEKTTIAECDDTSDCPIGMVCCVTPSPSSSQYSLLCAASCPPPAVETCNPLTAKCKAGTQCGGVGGHDVYFTCE